MRGCGRDAGRRRGGVVPGSRIIGTTQGQVVLIMGGYRQVGGREPFVQHFRWRVSDTSLKRSSCSLSDKAGIAMTAESIVMSIGCAGCESLLSSGMAAFQL